jgi:predicted MFS family arabinose efflux permease
LVVLSDLLLLVGSVLYGTASDVWGRQRTLRLVTGALGASFSALPLCLYGICTAAVDAQLAYSYGFVGMSTLGVIATASDRYHPDHAACTDIDIML